MGTGVKQVRSGLISRIHKKALPHNTLPTSAAHTGHEVEASISHKEKHGEGGGNEAKNWAWYFRRIVIRSKIWGCFEVLRNEKDVGIQLYGLKMRARLELQVCECPVQRRCSKL